MYTPCAGWMCNVYMHILYLSHRSINNQLAAVTFMLSVSGVTIHASYRLLHYYSNLLWLYAHVFLPFSLFINLLFLSVVSFLISHYNHHCYDRCLENTL